MDSIYGLESHLNVPVIKTLIIYSKYTPLFRIEVGPKVIEACPILKNVSTFTTTTNDAIEVGMTLSQLKNFVELHNHFGEADPWDRKDNDWVIPFFSKMSDKEFKELCQNADYLDSQRFLNNAANFLIWKFERMEYQDIQTYLNIVDDYTVFERNAMEADPLIFFTSIIASTGNSKLGLQRCIPSSSSSLFENCTKTNFTVGPQNFAFPRSLIHFTFNVFRVPGCLFFTLYYTCKYFFVKLKLIPCILLNAAGVAPNHKLGIICGNRAANIPLENIKTMYASFYVSRNLVFHLKCPPEFCHQFLSKIMRHNISTASISHENLRLTVMEFKNLFSNVTDLSLSFVKVIDPDEKEVTLDQLLCYIPKAVSVQIETSPTTQCFTSSTIRKMANLKREKKLNCFQLTEPPIRYLCGESFAAFIKNHANPACAARFIISFDNFVTEEFVSSFKNAVLKIIDSWDQGRKPTLMLRNSDQVLFFSDRSSPFYPSYLP